MKFRAELNPNLHEAFDNPYELKRDSHNNFSFKDEENSQFNVIFRGKTMQTSKGGLLGVEVIFDKNGSTDISKSPSPFRVFATVVEVMIQYGVGNFDYIEFSGDVRDKSRQKLYQKMRIKLQKELGWKYSEEDDQGRDVYQIIFKKKP
ncbi:MAG: hypothetical protein J7L15_01115 [Clostridiales bacterium]|nr:hypothetical protein [Clostridiales bacterium]